MTLACLHFPEHHVPSAAKAEASVALPANIQVWSTWHILCRNEVDCNKCSKRASAAKQTSASVDSPGLIQFTCLALKPTVSGMEGFDRGNKSKHGLIV